MVEANGQQRFSAVGPRLAKRQFLHVSASDLHEDLDQRTRERDEALEQLAATSDVLQIISRSPGDLESVFTAMMRAFARPNSACSTYWNELSPAD